MFITAGLMLFPAAGHDDAHISYWAARSLSETGRILNFNGERVEQSSSLLHVLLLAFLSKLTGIEMVTLGRLTAIAAGAAALVVLSRFVKGIAGTGAALSAVWIASTSVYLVYGSYCGMETPLVALTGLWVIISLAGYLGKATPPTLLGPGLGMGAYLLVRPESPILLVGLVAGAATIYGWAGGDRLPSGVDRRAMRGRLLKLAALLGALLVVLLGFRGLTFGQWAPQPVRAKFGGLLWASLGQGLMYFKQSVWDLGPAAMGLAVALAAGGGVLLAIQFRKGAWDPRHWLSMLYVGGNAAFILLSGGDWMEGGRFFVHFLPVSIAILAVALDRVAHSRLPMILVSVLLIGSGTAQLYEFAAKGSTGCPLKSQIICGGDYDLTEFSWFEQHNPINRRDMPVVKVLDRLVDQIGRRRPGPVVILSGQMGFIPYHLTERHAGGIRFIDRWGLVERTLTDCPSARRVARSQKGLLLDYQEYFRIAREQNPDCPLPLPDIIYDVHVEYSDQVAEQGYGIVYLQRGRVSCEDSPYGISSNEFVALRNDLMRTLGLQ